jgi:hypothetical protein
MTDKTKALAALDAVSWWNGPTQQGQEAKRIVREFIESVPDPGETEQLTPETLRRQRDRYREALDAKERELAATKAWLENEDGAARAENEKRLAAEADLAAAREALRPFAGLYDEEWPENTQGNVEHLKRIVGAARDVLSASGAAPREKCPYCHTVGPHEPGCRGAYTEPRCTTDSSVPWGEGRDECDDPDCPVHGKE